MRCYLIGALLLGVFATPDARAQARNLRLFLSPIGLSDPTDLLSPASDPTSTLGINPNLTANISQPRSLYVWAQIVPPGTPNNAVFNHAGLRFEVSGAGGRMAGFQFWNYTNGSYGNNTGRWQQLSQQGDSTSAAFLGVSILTGAGINNTAAAQANDRQYRRFATDGVTRIDCTLLGRIDVAGVVPGELQVRAFTYGPPVPEVNYYRGWGDEHDPENPIPEARIQVVPEPVGAAIAFVAVLFGSGAAMSRRRRLRG